MQRRRQTMFHCNTYNVVECCRCIDSDRRQIGTASEGKIDADRRREQLHSAVHCNTLLYTATNCNTLQHSATHCNTLGKIDANRRGEYIDAASDSISLQHTECCSVLPIP